MSGLSSKQCEPCEEGTSALTEEQYSPLLKELNGWEVVKGHHLRKECKFQDFVSALSFVNKLGELAENEGHHPNIFLTWGKVDIEIFTHKIDGLTESDFVLAAKIDKL